LTGIGQCYPDSSHYAQMAVARLPAQSDLPGFKDRLYDDFRIEVPCIEWQDRQFIRVSIQGYNTWEEVNRLIEALSTLLPTSRP
jgi:isopenicillin-N epimerase